MTFHIWIKSLTLFLISTRIFAVDYPCKDVKSNSLLAVGKSEVLNLCFHPKESSYFISQECKDFSCKALQKIKTTKLEESDSMRPGKTWCQNLGGLVEPIEIEGSGNAVRCLFPEESISISLNLLESWNGKYFSGPKIVDEN